MAFLARWWCRLGWHQWGPGFFSGRVLMRQCQRCRRTNFRDHDSGQWREDDGT